jgi:endonuclease/exonuclease/phosphatase family metal-dependent hydrolase
MRIVTYNIHGWRTAENRPNLSGVGDVLEHIGPDIIGLNEVYYPRVVEGSEKPALEALAERLGMHYVFGAALRWPAQDDMPEDAYGNALLSRWPVIASAAHHLTSKEEDPQHLLDTREERGLLEGRILLPGGGTSRRWDFQEVAPPGSEAFTAYSIHLDHTDEEARGIQLRVARTWLGRDRNRPHVVMGDFNAISLWDFEGREADLDELSAHNKGHNLTNHPDGPQVIAQMEKAGYVDLYRQFNPPGERSFLGGETAIRIDYIFASRALAPQATACDIWLEADGVSDHRPVWADFALG